VRKRARVESEVSGLDANRDARRFVSASRSSVDVHQCGFEEGRLDGGGRRQRGTCSEGAG
jgi:hypothetical protein